jgi:hypothetical protein
MNVIARHRFVILKTSRRGMHCEIIPGRTAVRPKVIYQRKPISKRFASIPGLIDVR